jgi:uncharacterized membrane protein YkvA (DUF1232 family)
MKTETIEQMISDCFEEAVAITELGELVSAIAESRGNSPDEASVNAGCTFICDYIQQVPYMIKIGWTSAINVGLDTEIKGILDAVTSYWYQDNDIIPDHLGVIGLLDDAYCSLTSLQSVSDHYRLQTGKYLFPMDLTSANKMIREFLGDPYGPELDQFVANTLHDAGIMDAVQAMASKEKQLDFSKQGTIWNHGTVESMDTAALRHLGLGKEE